VITIYYDARAVSGQTVRIFVIYSDSVREVLNFNTIEIESLRKDGIAGDTLFSPYVVVPDYLSPYDGKHAIIINTLGVESEKKIFIWNDAVKEFSEY
jgi:hypothetical protein